MKKWAAALWRHKVSYLGLSLVYAGMCLGYIDKDLAQQIAAGIYAAMVAQRH
jgi:hypothetical protein